MISIKKKIHQGIILIGMSGSGKTTVGKLLSKKINYKFIDSDELIAEHFNNQPLQVIVDSYKDKKDFLIKEKEIIKSINLNQNILATGGSACYAGETLLKKNSLIIFLNLSLNFVLERLGDFSQRGVILLEKDIKSEYQKRLKLYSQLADITIDCDNKSKTNIINEISNIF